MRTSATGAATKKPGRGRAILLRLLVYGALLALTVATFQYAAYVQRPKRQVTYWRPPPFSCWRSPDPRTVLQQTCRDAWDVVRGRYYAQRRLNVDYYPRAHDLPVVDAKSRAWQKSCENYPRLVSVGVYCCGQVQICGTEMSHDFLRECLGKTVQDYGGNPDAVPIHLWIDAHTYYPRVERVLQVLNEVGIIRVGFMVTSTNTLDLRDTAHLDAFVTDTTRTNELEQGERTDILPIVPVSLGGDQTRICDKTFARSLVAAELERLANTSRCYVVSCSRSNTIQDLVSFLAGCAEHKDASVVLHVPTASTNTPRLRVPW